MFREPLVQLIIGLNVVLLTLLMTYIAFGFPVGLIVAVAILAIGWVLVQPLLKRYNELIDSQRRR